MFDPGAIAALRERNQLGLAMLRQVETTLKQRFAAMDRPIEALVLAVAAGEPLLLIGPPGTAKSRLIRTFCGLIGLVDEDEPMGEASSGYFEYLLTEFTEPGELFGYYDINKLHNEKVLARLDTGMMQHARVVFLDEVFNASSAILNALLSVMNERMFHDRGRRIAVPLQCLFSAANRPPAEGALRGVFDRFLLRCWVDQVDSGPQQIHRLVDRGWPETYGSPPPGTGMTGLLDHMARLRADIRAFTADGRLKPRLEGQEPLYRNLAAMTEIARRYGASDVSNRRLVKMLHVMLIHRLYRASDTADDPRPTLGAAELRLFGRFFLDVEDPAVADKLDRLPYPMA